ncbi:MAG: serine/threonine-protein kinase [Waddliaceae bacterium]
MEINNNYFPDPPISADQKVVNGLNQDLGNRLAKVSNKVNAIAAKTFHFIASGADKNVWISVGSQQLGTTSNDKANHAYYTPKGVFLRNQKSALKKEASKMQKIMDLVEDHSNLAVKHSILSKDEGIRGMFTMKVDRAKSDFEKTLRNSKVGFQTRMKLLCDFVKGLAQLHRAGFAHGDIKPENSLVYEDKGTLSLKLADFGRAEEVKDESKTYKGNLRFAPPEGRLSQKGDVYGAAIVMIRTLEEEILNEGGDPLLPVHDQDRDEYQSDPSQNRRGIEKLIVEHKAFAGVDVGSLRNKIFRRLPRQVRIESWGDEKIQNQHEVLNQYIDQLKLELNSKLDQKLLESTNNLLKENKDGEIPKEVEEKIHELDQETLRQKSQLVVVCQLLKEMISTDPKKRPTAEFIAEHF